MRVIDRNGLVYDCRYINHTTGQDPKYALPKLKKYPLPDRAHVKSAIKFFNYVSPRYEKILAYAILKRMNEYGMSFDDITVGDNNRFKKYVPKSDHLAHHGIMGMHWGIRRFQPYPSGYRGDGEFVGKSPKEQKQAYKEAKRNYREAKQDYSNAKEYARASTKNLEIRKSELKSDRKLRKEAKRQYKNAKKFGSYYEVKEAKQNLKNRKLRKMKAVNEVQMAELLNDAKKKDFETAAANLDKAKMEMLTQKALYKASKIETKARQDAFNDVGAKVGLNGSSLGPGVGIPKKNNAYFRRNPDDVNSLQTRMIKEKGGIKTSDTYAKAYSKAYDEAIEKAKGVEFKSNVNKERLIRNAEKSKPSFRTETAALAKRASQMHTSGMTYAQIAKKLGIPETSVSYYLRV